MIPSHRPARLLLALIAMVILSRVLSAKPVGGTFDPFLADRGEQATKFRQAVEVAKTEDGKLEPLPAGVSGEDQRAITIVAYEHAISIMPNAPWCPDLLQRVAYLWSSPAVAAEQPEKALAAYMRLEREYPDARNILIAMCGEAAAYEAMHDDAHAKAIWQQLSEYQLPADASRDAFKQLSVAQTEAQLHLHPVRYRNGLAEPETQPATTPVHP